MTLITNRGNVRTNLKIDSKKKIWSDDTLDRYINEGQRWLINDPAMNWNFGESIGYLVPVQGYQEYLASTDGNPETFFSPKLKTLLKARASTGGEITFNRLPAFNSTSATAPSKLTEYAENFFINAGYKEAATYTTLHNMDTYDGDGTWVGSNDATTVATDASTYKEGSGSVSFAIDVSNSTANKATLTNSTFTSVDLSGEDLNDGGIILWVNLSSASDIKGFEVKFGSDSSNYYSARTYGRDVQGRKYADGWNRIFLPTVNTSKTGTPDLSDLDYLQVNIEFSSGETDLTANIDSIQYIDKYVEYFHTLKATDLNADSDESIVPSEYQFVFELYATYKAFSTVPGFDNQANSFYKQAKMNKNIIIEEIGYSYPQEFLMPPRV